MSHQPTDANIPTLILELTQKRGADKGICPAEVARSYGCETWHTYKPTVRDAARAPFTERLIDTMQGGIETGLESFKEPIRLTKTAKDDR